MAEERLGRYLLQEIIGQGAMGTVYRAHDPVLDRVVAIKTIRLDLNRADREDFERRFQREAQSSAKLNHPGIITVFDAGEVSNVAYITMEYLQGRDLRDLIKSKRLNQKQIANIAAQVADALDYAHQHGVVHRDVKPGNVMILAKGRAKRMDFGIARLQTSEMTLLGTALGTPKYMSPELVSGQDVDGRTDTYSLGIVLYQMLTGVAPFEGETVSTTMYQIMHDPAPHPSTLGIEIGPGFSYILNRALAKRPQDRYEQAKDMANDLRRVEALDEAPPKMRVLGLGKPVKLDKPVDIRLDVEIRPEASPHVKTVKQNTLTQTKPSGLRRTAAWAGMLVIVFISWKYFAGGDATPTSASGPADTGAAVANAATPTAAGTGSGEAASKQDTATLRLAVSPWGEILVDGKRVGISPPTSQITVEPGVHQLEIRNGSFPVFSESVTVSAGETRTIKHRF